MSTSAEAALRPAGLALGRQLAADYIAAQMKRIGEMLPKRAGIPVAG